MQSHTDLKDLHSVIFRSEAFKYDLDTVRNIKTSHKPQIAQPRHVINGI